MELKEMPLKAGTACPANPMLLLVCVRLVLLALPTNMSWLQLAELIHAPALHPLLLARLAWLELLGGSCASKVLVGGSVNLHWTRKSLGKGDFAALFLPGMESDCVAGVFDEI